MRNEEIFLSDRTFSRGETRQSVSSGPALKAAPAIWTRRAITRKKNRRKRTIFHPVCAFVLRDYAQFRRFNIRVRHFRDITTSRRHTYTRAKTTRFSRKVGFARICITRCCCFSDACVTLEKYFHVCTSYNDETRSSSASISRKRTCHST